MATCLPSSLNLASNSKPLGAQCLWGHIQEGLAQGILALGKWPPRVGGAQSLLSSLCTRGCLEPSGLTLHSAQLGFPEEGTMRRRSNHGGPVSETQAGACVIQPHPASPLRETQ